MQTSSDLSERIAYYERTNPNLLEQISKDLINIVRKRLGLNQII